MAEPEVGEAWFRIHCSTSVSNFKYKILTKYLMPEWSWRNRNEDAVFFGMYHIGDYLRLLASKGTRTVVWLGGDIKNLEKSLWRWIIPRISAMHVCENYVEFEALRKLGITANIKQFFFGDANKFQVSFKPTNKPHVFMCAHPEYKQAAGVDVIEGIALKVPDVTFHIYGIKEGFHQVYWQDGVLMNRDYVNLPNVIYHGIVPEEQFNKEIRNYQAGLRLNDFDGFSEVLAKSVLLGQYPVSKIVYPYIDHYETTEELINLLNKLKYKKEPNYLSSQYWRENL